MRGNHVELRRLIAREAAIVPAKIRICTESWGKEAVS